MPNIPLQIVAIYALVGAFWIVFSDGLLQLLVDDPALLVRLSVLKGWAFIVVTAGILYRLIHRDHAAILRSVESGREREELLQNVLETLPVGVWLLDREGKITHGNPAGLKIWGGARFVGIEQFHEYRGWRLATGKRIEAHEWGGARAIREGKTSLCEEIEIEGFDGVRRIILHSAVPVYGRQSAIIGAVVVNEEITARKQMEESLREQERVYRELFENNPQPMWVYAVETMAFLAVNDAAIEHYGYAREEFLHMTIRDIRPPEDVPALLAVVGKDRCKLAKVGVWRHRKKDSTLIDVEITTHDLVFDGRAARLVLVNDITERRRVERANAAYQEELRRLASEMSLIEERQRRRIATEIHDQVGQVLAMAKIRLGALQAADSLERCHMKADEIREFLEQAIAATRSLTFELSPPILYELGLEAAVQALCEKFQQEHAIRFRFVSDRQPKPLSDDVRVLLFQAVRELLVNIVKHARALNVEISCRRDEAHLRIVVVDDGRGFEPTAAPVQPPASCGFGLFSIRERLRHLGGEMTVDAAPGCGTRVTLAVPLQTIEEGVP